MAIMGRPTKLTPELIKLAHQYIYCEEGKAGWAEDGSVIPTVEGFASYLNIHRDTAYAWAKNDKNFSDILAEVKQQQAQMLLNGGLGGTYNPTIAKLILSGKHGYIEKREEDITSKGESINDRSTLTDEELDAKIRRIIKAGSSSTDKRARTSGR